MIALARANPRLLLLSGDIGNRLFDRFKAEAGDRFFNCGVAEANMMSMAAGLAAVGWRPVVYTINSFAVGRCFEQIKVDVCYHRVPVIIVGVGGGLSYASLQATHHSLEDVAVLRSLPGIKIVCPADPFEVRGSLRSALKEPGPVFIRLGKKGEPSIHSSLPEFRIGRPIEIREGRDVCLLGTGTVLPMVLRAADLLSENGVSARVVSHPTVKPLDDAFLTEVFRQFRVVAVIEEHSMVGGFGSALAEWRADHHLSNARLLRFGTADRYLDGALDQAFARAALGLTVEAIVSRVREALRE